MQPPVIPQWIIVFADERGGDPIVYEDDSIWETYENDPAARLLYCPVSLHAQTRVGRLLLDMAALSPEDACPQLREFIERARQIMESGNAGVAYDSARMPRR